MIFSEFELPLPKREFFIACDFSDFFSLDLFMISFLSSLVIKVLLLYLIIFVLKGACSFKRILKAQLNALYASFSKCINFSCKAMLKRAISKY